MDLVVANATILSGADEPLEADIEIRNGRIVAIQPGLALHAKSEVLHAAGRTVIPGLIDAHFHAYAVALYDDEIERLPLSYVALKARQRLERALHRGFTTVRDVAGGDPGLAEAIRQGLVQAPRYLYTGPGLSQTGGHGDPRDVLHEDGRPLGGTMTQVVDGPDALRRVSRELFRRGAHAIKLMTSGGVISLTDPLANPQFTAAEIAAVVEVASARGSYVCAHAYSPEAIDHSVRNGVRSIEHGNFLDEPTATLMAQAGSFLVPTLAAYDAMARRGASCGLSPISQRKNSEVLQAGGRAIEVAHAAGVPVGFGTDLMGDLEDDQLRGLALQVEVNGIRGALLSATETNAALLGIDDIGRLAPGSQGDLVVLDGDLLADPSLLWNESHPRTVVKGGMIV